MKRDADPSISPSGMLAFAAVARAGGIRRAAAVLGVRRSTTSRQLAQLEQTLGGRLVARSSRDFSLTELGAALLRQCEQLEELLKDSERIASRVAREPTGVLRVAASPIVGEELLPELVAVYLRRFPKVRLEVELSPDFVDLRRAPIDLAIRTGPIESASDLFATRLGTSMKGHYASPSYLQERGVPERPEELSTHDCIVVGRSPAESWAFRHRSGELRVSVGGSLRVDSYRLARGAAAAGAGIARLPRFFAQPLVNSGDLVPILEDYAPRLDLYAVHTAGRPAPRKIKGFIDLLKEALTEAGSKDIIWPPMGGGRGGRPWRHELR